jgi:LPXTG-motif cell wall-anchored protein
MQLLQPVTGDWTTVGFVLARLVPLILLAIAIWISLRRKRS